VSRRSALYNQLSAFAYQHSIVVFQGQHSWRSLPIQCRALNLQASMLLEGLAVTPTVNQRHVASLAKVSVCQMWLGNAFAPCWGSHFLGSACTQSLHASLLFLLPLHASCLGLDLPTRTHTHTSFKSLKHWQACAAAGASPKLCRCGHFIFVVGMEYLSQAANFSSRTACSHEDAGN